jgi:phage anti-repressor protein
MSSDKTVNESTKYESFVGKKVELNTVPKASLAEFLDMEDESEKWKKEWVGMPEFVQEENKTYKTISVHFRNKEDYEEFAKIINQPMTKKTKSIWHPRLDKTANSLMRWIDDDES